MHASRIATVMQVIHAMTGSYWLRSFSASSRERQQEAAQTARLFWESSEGATLSRKSKKPRIAR